MSDTGNGNGRGGNRSGGGGRFGKDGGGARGPGSRGPGGPKGGEDRRSGGAGKGGPRPGGSFARKDGEGGGKSVGEGRGPAGKRPYSARPSASDAGPRRDDRPARTEGAGGERKPFRPKPARDGAPSAEGRGSFKPKSRGMFSHGGVDGEGNKKPPRSYGRIAPDAGSAGGEERPRRPREMSDRKPGSDRARSDAPRTPRSDSRPSAGGEDASSTGKMRIAKRLARAGIASRRDAEGMIADGRIKVNGRILDTPALDVTGADRIEIDGKPIPAIERTRLWLFHKPAGTVTTNRDPEGRPTVFDRLPEEMPRVLSIGRLDINTEGLLLLTNDGGLARLLELPATGWLRRYRVRAHGEVKQSQLDELKQGIAVDGVFYGSIEASLDSEKGTNVWLTLGLREGKNREVKRVLGHLGLEVNRLIRLSYGPFQLGELGEGEVQEVKGKRLREELGERLIAEAGADFDAPIVNQFTNSAVKTETRREDGDERPKAKGGNDWISASDSGRPNKKKFGEKKREDALGRLETRAPRGARTDRPERGDRPFGERKPRSFGEGRDGKSDADAGPARRPASEPKRTANVWMAPGARALGEKRRADRDARDRAGDERPKRTPFRAPTGDRPSRPASADRPSRPPSGDRPARPPRGDGPRGPARPPRTPRG